MSSSTEKIMMSQKKLKLLVGGLGVALPTLVYLGNRWIFSDTELKTSISSYYHSDMRDIFVGILFSIGVFQLAYEGYDVRDRLLSDLGGILAIVTALYPTAAPGTERDTTGTIHLLAAGGFFVVLIVFNLFLFTKTSPDIPMTRRKKLRNMIYYGSGLMIFLSLISIILIEFKYIVSPITNPVFWLEYIGISAFGTSWLVKGEGIFFLNDDSIFEMNPWEIFGFIILVLLFLGSFFMLSYIFFI